MCVRSLEIFMESTHIPIQKAVRFFVGKSVAIPAASLAITRRIYMMFSLRCPRAGSHAEVSSVKLTLPSLRDC